MEHGRGTILLFLVAVLIAPGALVPRASAIHWCDFLEVSVSPTSGLTGADVDLSVILTNNVEVPLRVEDIFVRFPWDSVDRSWGSMRVPGFGSQTNILPLTLPRTQGPNVVAISIVGVMLGDISADRCGPFLRTLTIMPPSGRADAESQAGAPAGGAGPSARGTPPAAWSLPLAAIAVVAIVAVASMAIALGRKRSPR